MLAGFCPVVYGRIARCQAKGDNSQKKEFINPKIYVEVNYTPTNIDVYDGFFI